MVFRSLFGSLVEGGETRPCRFGLLAVGIQANEVVVELFGVCDVVLPFLELGGLEQFLRLVPAAGIGQGKE